MTTIVPLAVLLVALLVVAHQVARAWSRGRYAAPGRYELVSSTVEAVVALAMVRAVAPPGELLSWAWTAAVVAVGVGIAGAVRRWPALGWAPRRRRHAAGYLVVGAAALVVLA